MIGPRMNAGSQIALRGVFSKVFSHGKGSHRNYEHLTGVRVTISGQPGDDAKPYQEREARDAIEESQQ